MRTGKWWMGASLGMVLLLAGYGLKGQESLRMPTPAGGPGLRSTTTLNRASEPAPGGAAHNGGHESHEAHAGGEEAEEGEEASEGGLFGNFDFLLVRPRRRPHDYAILDPNGNNAAVEGSVVHFDWETVGAYRIGLGYKLNHGWEIGGVYTYVHGSDDQTLARPTGGAIFATMSAPFVFDSVDGVRGSSNLDLDTIDVELAKRWEVSEDFHLRLLGGARISTIQQKMGIAYDFSSIGFGISNVNSKIQYDGIGPRVGGEGWWKMAGSGLGIWGKASISVMAGDFKTSLSQFVNSGRTPVIAVNDKFNKVVPVTDVGIGLGWMGENMTFKVGYELSNYFGMVDIIDFPSGTSFKPFYRTGDLSLEALSASVGFAY